jgi:cobalt/nickel transport system permease protein
MSFHHLDQYAHIQSPVTRAPPVIRLLGTVVVAVGAAALPLGAWVQISAFTVLVALLSAVARVPAGVLIRRMSGPLALVLFASVALLFLVPGETVLQLGWLSVTDQGLLRFGSASGRAAVALGAAIVLVSTTGFPELIMALRQLRLPRGVTASLGLAYRLLYILVDEVERMKRAALSRNAGGGARKWRQLLIGITAAALGRSFARGERTYRAMLARGFQGEVPSLYHYHSDVRTILLFGLLVVAVGSITLSAYLTNL